MPDMAYREVTSTGWFGRIGDSIKGMLLGFLLVPGAIVLLVVNERNAVRDIRANEEIGSKVVSIANDSVDPAREGKLVHLNGPAKTDEVLKNDEFAVAENAIRLSWVASIYQWEESSRRETRKKLGGGEETVTTYTYKKTWSDKPIDSSGFKERGHENKGTQSFRSGSAQAEDVALGAFKLPAGLINQIKTEEPLPLRELPAPMAERGRISQGVFHTGNPESPVIGDEKVEFLITKPGDVSVMAVQSGNSFKHFVASNGKEKFLLYEGLLSAGEVVKGEERKAMLLRWALRAAGLVLMWFGFLLLIKPLSVLADIVPMFGSLVGTLTGGLSLLVSAAICLLVIALSWVAFRPVLGIGLLVAAGGCLALVLTIRSSKAKAARLAA